MPIIGRDLGATLRKGFIPLPLVQAREIASNDFPDASEYGGILAKNSTPILQRINAETDKAIRLNWAASNVDEITWQVHLPADVDKDQPLYVKVTAKMLGASGPDTPVLAIGFFKGTGDTNAGGNTAAVTATEATVQVKIAAADHGGEGYASVSLTPGTHGTDALAVMDAWIEYTKRLETE